MSHHQTATPLQSVTAGAAAGCVESFVTYPTEYVKTRRQLLTSSQSTVKLFVDTIKSSGIRVLYSGAGAFCISNAAKSGVRFLTFDSIRDKLPRDAKTGKHTKVSSMIAGVAAGVAESISVVTPGENIKTKIVDDRAGARQFKSTGSVIRSIVKTDGIAGMFHGVVPVASKQAANALVRFTTYQTLLDAIKPSMINLNYGEVAPALAGAGAGIVTVYATMPFDVVKTKMQSLEGKAKYGGTVRCFQAVVQQSGLRGLWKGTTPRLIRLSVSGAISFSIYSKVIEWMQNTSSREVLLEKEI